MAPQTYSWISLWFLVTVPVIAWDVGYCFMRPRSFEGGDLHWIWAPYSIYQNIDLVYGVKAYQNGEGFTNAQALMNVFETLGNILYLYLAHISQSPVAPLVGFTSASLTVAKTILYWAQEYFCGYCAIGHNSARDIAVFWILPNGLWITVPSLVALRLGRDIVRLLRRADAGTKAKKNK